MAETDISRLRLEKGAKKGGPARRRHSRLFWAAAALLAAAALAFTVRATGRTEVRAATATLEWPSQAVTALSASGYVVAGRKASLASKTSGRLVWLGVEEGSRIEKGQVVARLESEDLTAALAEAAAALEASSKEFEAALAELDDAADDLERKKSLIEGGFVPRSAFDQAEARYRKARASADAARARVRAAGAARRGAEAALGYTSITAPFSGVVLTKNADIGDIITPLGAAAGAKAAVVTIADLGTLEVEVDVAESNIGRVGRDMPAEIELDALPGERFSGRVHMIVPTADRTKASVLVKVRFLEKDPRVMPEMSAKVSFLSRPLDPGEDHPVTTVPASAVLSGPGGKPYLFRVDGDRARRTVVVTGRRIGGSVEVEGLEDGARVVADPPEGLGDGDRIKVLED